MWFSVKQLYQVALSLQSGNNTHFFNQHYPINHVLRSFYVLYDSLTQWKDSVDTTNVLKQNDVRIWHVHAVGILTHLTYR